MLNTFKNCPRFKSLINEHAHASRARSYHGFWNSRNIEMNGLPSSAGRGFILDPFRIHDEELRDPVRHDLH